MENQVVETKKIEIDWKGNKEIVEIKKFDFGEWNEIQEQATEFNIIGKQVQTRPSLKKAKEIGLLRGIVKAPFEINIDNIRRLPLKLGQQLYEEISNFNGFGDEAEEKKS